MKDKKINERESLELISEMISRTKQGIAMKQDYNRFLLYGYAVVIVALVLWLLIRVTGDGRFMFGWFALFLPYLWHMAADSRKEKHVVTYVQSMVENVWKVIGSLFGLTILALLCVGWGMGRIDFALMMPLSLIYAGIGMAMTGLVIRESGFVWTPLVGLGVAAYMLVASPVNDWNLLFGVSFLVFMVIPVHVARNKVK